MQRVPPEHLHTILLKQPHRTAGVFYRQIGPYDFHDEENADEITECSHKNRIYCIMQNVNELIKSRSLHLNYIAIWTIICKY